VCGRYRESQPLRALRSRGYRKTTGLTFEICCQVAEAHSFDNRNDTYTTKVAEGKAVLYKVTMITDLSADEQSTGDGTDVHQHVIVYTYINTCVYTDQCMCVLV